MRITLKVNLIIITTVTIIIVGTFIVLGQHFDRQIENHLLTTSRAVYNNILIFRQWIAQKDGVFLKKTEDEIINPFLHHPELVTTFNDTLVLRNPAMVTRELSNLSYTMGKGFSFHLTSLKYINPANQPDDFERTALKYYDKTDTTDLQAEFYRLERIEGKSYFRYFGPFYTQESCLSCHAAQGYKVGDLRGGISILLSADQHEEARKSHLVFFTITALLSILALSIPMAYSIKRSVIRPLKTLENAAETMESGKYDFEIDTCSNDEIGRVATAFNAMRSRIKKSTEDLSASEEKYRNLTEHSLEAIAIIDVSGKIIDCNDKLGHLAGSIRQTLLDINFYELIDYNQKLPIRGNGTDPQGSEHFETLLRSSDNLKIPVEIYLIRGFSLKSAQDLSLVYIRDLSERKKIEEYSIQTEKMYALGQVSAGIAHEIRNPLFALCNNMDFLQRKFKGEKEFQEVYPEFRESIDRIQNLVSAILDFARPHELKFEIIDVEEIVDKALLLVEKQFEKSKITIEKVFNHHHQKFEVDPHKLEQVFVNLFLNSFQAMTGSGKLLITTSLSGSIIRIRIDDTGCGIPEEDLTRVFDPFYSKSANGTGLGMAIVQRILDQHQAHYRIESKEDLGTTFYIEFFPGGE